MSSERARAPGFIRGVFSATNRESCENCGESDNVAVLKYIPWLEERRFVCEDCLFGDGTLFGRVDPKRPSLNEYVDLGELILNE